MRLTLPYGLVMILAAGVASFGVLDNIYYQGLGLDIAAIGIMVFWFNIAVTCAELPFALLFDKKSTKLSLYIGFIIRICAFIIFALHWGFSWLILAQILAGIATAAGSGTTNALVLNAVKEQNYENMSAEQSRLTFLSSIGALAGASLGVVVFQYYPAGIWWLACLFFLGAIMIVSRFPDRPAEGHAVPVRDLISAWLRLFKLRDTYLLIIANAAAIGPLFLWQFKFTHISTWFVIIGFYIITLAAAAAGKLFSACKLSAVSLKWTALVNIAATVCFAFAQSALSLPLAFGFCALAHIILSIQIQGLYHARVDNTIRAGAGSVISLADSLLVAFVAPIIGFLADKAGISAAIAVSALLYAALALLAPARAPNNAPPERTAL